MILENILHSLKKFCAQFFEQVAVINNRSNNEEISHHRLQVVIILFLFGFSVLSFRLFDIVFLRKDSISQRVVTNETMPVFQRADIVDRNDVLLAVNLATASLYANPTVLIDPKEAADKLSKVLPGLNYKQLLNDLKSKKNFVWIKRNLTPKEQYAVNNLGIPGLYFEKGEKRIYPHDTLLCHVLGYVGLDGKGLAGAEKYFDEQLQQHMEEGNLQPDPLKLTIDVRAQNIVHEELTSAIKEFSAVGAVGIIMDATNGEVMSMVSLPDFDPHNPGTANADQLFNRATLGLYEMGSVFKAYTMAMALDTGIVTMNDSYDVNAPIKIARFTIHDYHPQGGSLTVPEIFMHSSNIGSAKISLDVGKKRQKQFLKTIGLLSPLEIEIPEKASPIFPSESKWTDISTMTISYGHGIAVTPMHIVKTIGALVNGGTINPVTIIKKDVEEEEDESEEIVEPIRVIKKDTSVQIRKLFRLVVEKGTGKRADVPGYLPGGKTSTADKSAKGGYNRNTRLSSFVGAFPIHSPRYVVLVMLDEPKGTAATGGYATAGMTAAPVVGNIISRIGPLFGMQPIKEVPDEVLKELHIDNLSEELESF
jgi:cell division protein FtsI (penicillin-binding protein 3)